METSQKKFIKLKIGGEHYALPKSSTFEELSKNILIYLGYLTKKFIADEMNVVKTLDPSDFEVIEAIIDDKYEYEVKDKTGKYLRCKVCKQNLSLATYTCKHLSKCKRDVSRSSLTLKHSLLSETLSSIDPLTESEKTNSSFLSTSKENIKIQTNFNKNTSSSFTKDSSNAEHDNSESIELKE